MEKILTQEQSNAMDIVFNRLMRGQNTVLVGAAGSGKSFLLSKLVEELSPYFNNIVNLSFTAASVRNMIEKGLHNCSTIHRLLYKPIIKNGVLIDFERKDVEELRSEVDLIIIDEFSMVDKYLMDDLEAIGVPILLVGDDFQLPPVNPNVNRFYGTYDAKLTTVIRQDSGALLNALTKLRTTGELPKLGIHDENFAVFRKNEMPEEWVHDLSLNFICGRNNTRERINTEGHGRSTPMAGDRIVFLKNNYKQGLFNGQTAFIKTCRQITGNKYKLTVEDEFNGEEYKNVLVSWRQTIMGRGNFNIADFAFCRTCHKVQGLTLDRIAVVDEKEIMREPQLKTRWLYTALSRASKKCVLFI